MAPLQGHDNGVPIGPDLAIIKLEQSKADHLFKRLEALNFPMSRPALSTRKVLFFRRKDEFSAGHLHLDGVLGLEIPLKDAQGQGIFNFRLSGRAP